MPKDPANQTMELVRRAGVLRPRDLDQHDIPRQYLRILEQAGKVQRVGRGLYTLANAEATEHHTVAQACKRVPQGVICLLTALRMHDLTTQLPHEIWMAIDRKNWRPRVEDIPLRIVRFSGAALTTGIEHRRIEGVEVQLYGPAKTVADCFKYRNKIGLDVALEALQDYWRQRRGSLDELLRYARICRVANVMRPYLEAMTQ